MKFSKFFVGLATVLFLTSCGPTGESTPVSETPAEHTITFHANWNYGEAVEGEPEPTTLTVEDGAVVAAEDIPTLSRDGYIFKAWCTTPAATQTFDWTKQITKDYDVYASWIEQGNFDEVSLVGTINGWDPTNDDYLLTTEDGIHYEIEHFLLQANDIWKVVLNDAWEGQITGNDLDVAPDASYYTVLTDGLDAGNIKMLKSGYFDISVDLSAAKKLSFVFVEEYVSANPIVDYEVYLAGSFTDPQWGTDLSTAFTGPNAASGTWVLENYVFEGGEFKLNVYEVYQDGTKGGQLWVGAEAIETLPEGWSNNGGNIAVVAGTYTLSYTITDNGSTGTLVVEGEAAGPILSVVTYNIALAGSFTTPQWGADGNYMFAGPDAAVGIWELTAELPADGEFKLNLFKVYEDWSMDTNAVWLGSEVVDQLPLGWADVGGNIKCTAGTYTLTYTIYDSANPGQGLLTITAAGGAGTEGPEIMDPIPGEDFSLGFYSTQNEEYYYFSGEMSGHCGATTTDMLESAAVRVEEATNEGEFYIWYLDASYSKKYICAVENGTYKNFTIDQTEKANATVWTYDEDYQTFFATLSGTRYFMGTYGSYTTFNLCAEKDLEQGNYIAHLYW